MKCLWFECGKTSDFGLLNKSSCLAAALGVTKFTTIIGSHFFVLLKSDLDVQRTHHWLRLARLSNPLSLLALPMFSYQVK
jgi:hypothetical protein